MANKNEWRVVETIKREVDPEGAPGVMETIVSLTNAGMSATISMMTETTIVEFEHDCSMYALAEAARLLAVCADTIGDLHETDGMPLALTVETDALLSDATLRFQESAERFMLVAYFCDELSFILDRM